MLSDGHERILRCCGADGARAAPAPLSQTPHAASASLGLVVLAEDTHKTLLAHRICTDEDIYHRQGALAVAIG